MIRRLPIHLTDAERNVKARSDELAKLRAKVLGEKPARKTKVKP